MDSSLRHTRENWHLFCCNVWYNPPPPPTSQLLFPTEILSSELTFYSTIWQHLSCHHVKRKHVFIFILFYSNLYLPQTFAEHSFCKTCLIFQLTCTCFLYFTISILYLKIGNNFFIRWVCKFRLHIFIPFENIGLLKYPLWCWHSLRIFYKFDPHCVMLW